MLQPRKRKFILKIIPKGLLLCVIILLTFTQNLNFAKGEDEKNGLIKDKIKRGDRVIRHGDVNIVVLDDFDRRKITPSLGLLSTTARTFIQEGTTTEFATHVYGTTVGDKYAHIVSTGSKIFYDNIRPSKDKTVDPIITIPALDSLIFSEDNYIIPSKVIHEKPSEKFSPEKFSHKLTTEKRVTANTEETSNKLSKSLKANILSVSEKTPVTVTSPGEVSSKNIHNHISVRKEISIKPARVKVKNELPTFTVKQDSSELESHVNQIQNSEFEVDNVIVLSKNEKEYIPEKTPHLHTTTYFGFADFVTTAGNTVIIFTPQTKKPVFEGIITSIQGEPVLVQNTVIPSNTRIVSPSPLPITQKPIELVESVETTELSEINASSNEQSESNESVEYIESDQHNQPTEASIEEDVSNNEHEAITTQKEYKYDEGVPISTPHAIETTAESIDSTVESVTENLEENLITTTLGDDLVKNKEVPFLESSLNLESSFSIPSSPSSTADVYQTISYSSITPSLIGLVSLSESQSTTPDIPTTEEIPEITTFSNISGFDESSSEFNNLLLSNSSLINTERNGYVELGTITTPKVNKSEEEVELVFKTLYTTYTYLTTYFERSTTQVKSREEVVTNVITSTLDSIFLQQATDPAVAGLFSGHREAKYLLTNGVGRPTTFYHRISSEPVSENEIVSSSNEAKKATPSLKFHPRLTESKLKPLYPSSAFDYEKKSTYHAHIPSTADPHALLKTRLYSSARASHRLGPSLRQTPPLHLYKSTIIRNKFSNTVGPVQSVAPSVVNDIRAERTTHDSLLSEEVAHNSVIISAPLTSTKETTEQTQKKIFLSNDSDDDQLSQESNTEGTRPNPLLISLQTSYTTYTYFTTIYKGSTSNIISRLETVTNVNTELIKPTSTEFTSLIEEATAPVTYYTTYTYWTTFYKDGSTMIKSRQETVSNVVAATQIQASTTIPIQPTSLTLLDPVTYYTTFTYYTTSYVGNSSVISSRLQTVTNIIEASKTITENLGESSSKPYPIFEPSNSASLEKETKIRNDLINVLPSSVVISDKVYPQFFENISYSEPKNNLNNSSVTPVQDSSKPTGTISVEEGRIVDAFNISTTYYTTRVIGTYIQTLYAELIESTSSIHINTEQRSNLINPSTVILNDRIFQTGLLLTNDGSIIKGNETTHYATKIIGSIINGQYTSVTESLSSIQIAITPTKVIEIKPTTSLRVPSSTHITEFTTTSPSPAVIESSLNEHHEGNDEDDNTKSKSRRKSFTPVIRPFASRSRPTFLPKKKTGETLVAATITRGITPTIVASPALKATETRVFGSVNRNRFAGGSRKIPTPTKQITELESTSPTTRRFSRPKSNVPFSTTNSFPRASSIVPAPSSGYRRGSGYRPSSSRAADIQPSSSVGSRFRIRPSSSRRYNFVSTSTTPKINEDEQDEIDEDASVITEQTLSSFDTDELSLERLPVSSTEVNQRNNPLLRFRKPSATRQSPVPSTSTIKTTTQRRNIGSRRNDKLTPPPTTAKPSTSFPPRSNYLSNKLRLKPANSLFPPKNIPTKTEEPAVENGLPEILAEESAADGEQIDSGENVTEVEPDQNFGNSNVEEKSTRGSRVYNPVSIKPFPRRGRVKRQSEYGYKYENIRSQNSRYRRPTVSQNTFPDYLYYDDLEYTTEDISARSIGANRNTYSKSRNTQPLQHSYHSSYQQQPEQQISHKIRPSGVSHGRTPFTLREKMPSTSPAPQRSSSRHRGSSTNRKHDSYVTKRPSRQRYYSTTTEPAYRSSNRKQLPTRRTSNSRSRYKDDYNNVNTYSSASFDGTITVTYKIPTEATIPIVNGKVTEYKNVVTAKPSTQVLGPNQYSTVTGKNGLTTLQLVAENSETMLNGIVEVTKYIIQEFPTSSITFTPTIIRGRKTSFSHVIPSTVYEVRPEVSTIPPQLNGNAPLANLLLSQLLLGNLGIQPTLNPLLGLKGQQANGQPVTEYKTRTTSYVTTITHSTSTVIPVTLRGKEIKTTIVESSTEVITATEYLTDTVVITPTNIMQAPTNQLNTLLLPALLQAQLLNQPQNTVTAASPPMSSGDDNIADNLQLIQDNPMPSRVLKNTFNLDNDNVKVNDDLDQQKDNQRKKLSKPKSFDSPIEPAETSVVTLYLSGRRPGEFSTVLSTVTLDDEKSATLRKRHVDTVHPPDLKPSDMLQLHTSFPPTDEDYIDSVLRSGLNDISIHMQETEHQETQSLESIIGDVSEHMLQKPLTTQLENGGASASSTKTFNQASNHFLLKNSAEDAPFQRNSTTPVSRGERKKRSPEPIREVRKIVRKLGLFPESHLEKGTNNSELLKASSAIYNARRQLNSVDTKQNNTGGLKNRSNRNRLEFIKNNSSTVEDEGRGRYNLATKVMSNGVEVIIALDKSTLPGSPQLLRVLPTSIRPITLTPSTVTDHMIMMLPHGLQDIPDPFITKTYFTTYTYLTTFLNEGITSTLSQEKVVSNIFTENVDSTSPLLDVSSVDRHVTLSSSPILATKVFETTYNVESTIRNGDTPHVVLSQQTVSNTITAPEDFLQPSEATFNEISPQPSKETPADEYSIHATEKLSANFETEAHNIIDVKPSAAAAADITKTYFVTYTYYSTLLENGSTVVRSKVATSSDVVTEKYYVPLKRTKVPLNSLPVSTNPMNEKLTTAIPETLIEKPIHILATKTYLTTFTYFTTLLQENKTNKSTNTMIRSRTKVVQNLVTETLNPDLLNSEYLSVLKNSLKKDTIAITATATLNDGQKLEITAINDNSPSTIPDQVTSSLEENEVYYNEIGNENQIKSENTVTNTTGPAKNPKINETRYAFSTAVLPTATVVKNGITLSPGSQVIKFTDLVNGNVSVIPVSDPVSKYPLGGQHVNKPNTKIQMNDLLSLGSALKPVINAVAGLWQNNVKSNIKASESNIKPVSRPYIDKNPVEDLLTSLKPPNRTPIYIPVGPILDDNEGAESEDIYQHQYPDVNERNTLSISGNKETVEKPLVSGGGIPISPGQVITANTDVIVGTPAVLGPRPPPKNSNDKSDVPIGMRPPPVSSLIPSYSSEEADRGSSINNKYGDFIKIPPKPLSPTFLNNGFPSSNNIKHSVKPYYKYGVDQKISLPSEIKFSQVHPNAPPPPTKKPTPTLDVDENIIQPAKLQHPILIEHSTLNPLLVNLRPSQVAQVIIPHGSQTAFVYSDEPISHNTKGEIFNDPSPYPEENVNPGFVGLEVYGPVNSHAHPPHAQGTSSKVSSNTIHLDIPINPFVVNGSITESHHFVTVNLDSNSQMMPSSNEINFVNGEEPLQNDVNNNYSATVHSNIDVANSPNHLLPWQPPAYSSERPHQRPYIFPQDKPHVSSDISSEPHPHFNLINSHGGNEANDESIESVIPRDKDELIQEMKIKSNSNSDVNPTKSEDLYTYNVKESSNPADSDIDFEFNHNWEILKEKPAIRSTTSHPTVIKNNADNNSTIREHGSLIYSQWNTIETSPSVRPNFSEITVHGNIGHLNHNVATVNENVTKVNNRKPVSNRNSQDDVVIGLSPPPLLQPSAPPPSPPVQPIQSSHLPPSVVPKIPRPSISSLKPTLSDRKPPASRRPPPLKNKPKPTNPPYPFEKPTPVPPTHRPKPAIIIDKPPPNILYETNAPNFGDDLMKLKPLNTTGKIEPVKKWSSLSTTGKPNLSPVYGNVEKVQETYKKEETKSTAKATTAATFITPAYNGNGTSDTSASQSDTKIIVIEKQDRTNFEKTTELISKWSESGVISSSKNDIEEAYEDRRTPLLEVANRTKSNSVPNTIFGNLYTRPPPANIIIIPTHSTTQHHTAISMVIDQDPSSERDSDASFTFNLKNNHIAPTSTYPVTQSKVRNKEDKPANKVEHSIVTPTYYITHTTTAFVTITQSTVIERDGQPITKTVVLTKTQTSTLIDTVTKVETLLQPTNVLSIITSTIPVIVSKEIISTVTPDILPSIVTPIYSEKPSDDDSIFVVMTDKKSSHIAPAAPVDPRPTGFEVQVPDEANEISPNDILFSGIYTQHADNECRPECKVTKNEMCQKVDNTMRCVCRPGFARIFPDHPCKPTYTYLMRVPLDRQGPDEIRYTDSLADRTSPSHQQLTEATRDGLDRMVMQSNLRDIYHGVVVSGFEPAKKSNKAAVVYIVQLSENAEETKLQDEIHKTLKANNYSLGGTDVYAAPDMYHFIQAEDFDECSDNKYHDCSDNAQCFNLRGTYTCSCKEGFTDMSYNAQFPGRVCSADGLGCELCNYHGTCYYKAEEEPTCECFQWYAGEFCQINLKVTLISLIAIGILLTILLIVCLVMTCNKPKSPEILRTAPKPHVGFRRYRSVTNIPGDKRAIVSVDTSSEGSIERTPPPLIKKNRIVRSEPPRPVSSHGGESVMVHNPEQRDRNLTVLIPRAKYRPVSSQPSSTLLTMSTFGPEQKLLNYAASRESSRTPEKKVSRCSMHSRRLSNSTNMSAEAQPRKKISAPRRPSSGALVSAGFEVSATVRRTQELDEAFITPTQMDLNQPTYNSIRTVESSTIVDVSPLPVFESTLEDFISRVDKLGTVSEARSYDETTIQPPMRSLHNLFHLRTHTCDSKHSSSHKTNLDENHTMGERDLGSTYMPKSQLYKPDNRESDGSNFDSL